MSSKHPVVVVVGAGIVGASVALHLAEGGADVVVVEAARAGRATAAGAGIVSRPWRRPRTALSELQEAAAAGYPELAARVGAGFEVVGELFVAPPGPLLEDAEAGLRAALVEPVEVLAPEAARAAFPYLAPELAAVGIASSARVDGEDVRLRLLDAAVAAGARVLDGEAELQLAAGRVAAVQVGPRRMATDTVVVAGGAWSAALAAAVGVALPVAPQRGQIVHLGVADDTAAMPVVQPIGADHYLVPFADRRVVVGATRETGSGFDPRLTAAGVTKVLGDALRVAPGLAAATVLDQRVGLRPVSADGAPLLGPVEGCPGLWVATGMGPSGLTLGPLGGQLVAEAVLGRDPSSGLSLDPFVPARFSG